MSTCYIPAHRDMCAGVCASQLVPRQMFPALFDGIGCVFMYFYILPVSLDSLP